jgi:hypothetical protein
VTGSEIGRVGSVTVGKIPPRAGPSASVDANPATAMSTNSPTTPGRFRTT